MPFLFAHGINRVSHNIAYVILVQLNLFIVRYNTVLVIIRIKIGPQMTS